MCMNYIIRLQGMKVFCPNVRISSFITILLFTKKNIFEQKLQKILFYQKYVHLCEKAFIDCSRITIVHVHLHVFFSKIHPACQSDANGIKPGSNYKMTDKHAAEYSETVR